MRIDFNAIGDDEYASFYRAYIQRLRELPPDVYAQLASQRDRTTAFLGAIPEDRAGYRYAPGKWSIRDVVGHLADAERIMSYRALRIARGDQTALPGFDETAFAQVAGADHRPLPELAADCAAVRGSTLALFAGLDATALARRGNANGHPVSVRALAAIIAGHEIHHLRMIEEKYLATS